MKYEVKIAGEWVEVLNEVRVAQEPVYRWVFIALDGYMLVSQDHYATAEELALKSNVLRVIQKIDETKKLG